MAAGLRRLARLNVPGAPGGLTDTRLRPGPARCSSWPEPGGQRSYRGGDRRGSEVLAHLGALSGLPVAANCVSAAAGRRPATWQLVRQRWAGSVLEEAVLEAPCALLTVAADALTLAR